MGLLTRYDLLHLETLEEVLKHLPVGRGWFSPQSVSKDGQVGKLVRSGARGIAEWREAIREARRGLYLNTAVGDDLDRWGEDLALPRRLEETDDNYRARMLGEILRPKGSVSAIVGHLSAETGLDVKVHLPWKLQDWRSDRTPNLVDGAVDPMRGRSGVMRRTSAYYMPAVIDIETNGWDPALPKLLAEVIATARKAYFTANLSVETAPLVVVAAPDSEVTLHYEAEVRDLVYAPVRSGRGERSGGQNAFSAMALLFEVALTDPALALLAAAPAEVLVTDLYSPVRSVFNTGRSPRSGAKGEQDVFIDTPKMFGGVTLSPGVQAAPAPDRLVQAEYYLPRRGGRSTRSGSRPRSGAEYGNVVTVRTETNVVTFKGIRDDETLGAAYSFGNSPFTWDDLGEFTWQEALDGAAYNLTPIEVTVTVD